MAKLFAIILATVAAISGVQAQSCPGNARLCGSEIVNDYQCVERASLIFLTPVGNEPEDCIFPTNEFGEPQARGTACCAIGRCTPSGNSAICD
ncbi:unnamed protein product [Parascedosporium putredinis]|uniref:Pheromone n=1 Tax=Parascedosporium putredinis TaxID=1442378 RepID=A0A9P1H4I0_9PEZI|nr:unnamed protein product [Parascedosporium putredinis]CAI7996787.1 unnamed protein product [Parascedosporium putredinis]